MEKAEKLTVIRSYGHEAGSDLDTRISTVQSYSFVGIQQ